MDDIEWFKNEIKPIKTFSQAHVNSIECIDFNHNNPTQLASGSHDTHVKVWDVDVGKEIMCLKGHIGGIWALKYNQDGNLLFSGSVDKKILVWDTKSGKNVGQLDGHQNYVEKYHIFIYQKIYCMAISPDGNKILTGDKDGKLLTWDIKTMTLNSQISASKSIVYSCEFLTDNIAICSDARSCLFIYDLNASVLKGKNIESSLEKNVRIQGIALIPKSEQDCYQVIGAYRDNNLRKWEIDPTTYKFHMKQEFFAHFDATTCVAFQGNKIASGGRDGSGRIWNLDNLLKQNPLFGSLMGHVELISSMVFMPKQTEHQILATCSWDERINLYKI